MGQRGIGTTVRGDDRRRNRAGTFQLGGTDRCTADQGDWFRLMNNHAACP